MTDAPTIIPTLAAALEKRAYTTLTPVQLAVTAPELEGADLLVSAQTGSGKTVGFGLAIAPTLLNDQGRFGRADTPLALVIAPTRELALQVKREFDWLFAEAGAVVASCVGGMDMRTEKRALERGAHIVVATPGRLRDHIQRGSLDMSGLRAVVLDEADEMLDLGFREDLEFILGEAPEDRRTLMFSATVPAGIAHLAKNFQKPDAVRVTTAAEKSQHADIEYRALNVAASDPENAIINVLRYYEAQNAIVFCNTRAMVNRLTARFSNRGFLVVALSGELSQNERTHALQAMRDGRARVCVATDVAARGIDLPNLELVIHAELPTNSEILLHRSGRTGRAGRKGVSVLIVPGRSRAKAERLLKFGKINAEWAAAPSAEEVLRRDEERLLSDPVWQQEITADEQGFVSKLLELHSPEQIAAAYLRLYQARQSAPEDLAPVGSDAGKRAPREAFGPSTWFAISVGRDQNAEPRWLLPMLCRAGNISKDDIGAIRVQDKESYVELADKSVAGFLTALGPEMQLEEGATLRKLDKAPDVGSAPRPAPRKPRGDERKFDKPRPVRDRPAPAADGPAPERKPRHSAPAKSAYHPDNAAPADSAAAAPKRDHGPAEREKTAYKPKDKPKYEGKPKPAFKAGPAAKPKYEPKPKPDHTGAVVTYRKGASDASTRLGPDGKPVRKPAGKPAGKPFGKSKHRQDDVPREGGQPVKRSGFAAGGKPRVAKGGGAVLKRKPTAGSKPKR